MARPKEKEVVMTKQWKRTYRIDKKTGKKMTWKESNQIYFIYFSDDNLLMRISMIPYIH